VGFETLTAAFLTQLPRRFATRLPGFAVAISTALLLLPTPAGADDTFIVDSVADLVESDPVDIHCQTVAGTCTLRAAVMQANLNPGHTTILLPAGTFVLSRLPTGGNGADSGDLNLTKQFLTAGELRIEGAGRAATIIDGGDLDRVFHVASGASVRLFHLTVRNGSSDFGGGIWAEGSLRLFDARITGNESSLDGGGLAIDTADAVYIDSTEIDGNVSGSNGGGIYLSSDTDDVVDCSYCTIRDNEASFGGGLFHNGTAPLSLYYSTFSGNEARSGGGIYLLHPTAAALLHSSTLVGNLATDASPGVGLGGGLLNQSTLYVVDSTLSGNRSKGDGGGLFNGSGTATLYNSTVVFNEADSDADVNGGVGGGIRSAPGGIFAIRNSVLAGNTRSGAPVADDCSGNVAGYGHNRLGSFAGCNVTHTGACGGADNLLGSIAELGPLRFNGGPTPTHAIQPGSGLIDDVDAPCICQDSGAAQILADQRKGPRISGARCDVGAYESGALPPGSLFSDGFENTSTARWN
jgi:hypothetical protein